MRRLHSLLGLVFGGYVTVHLLVNFSGFWPKAYQQNVDKIHSLEPMLPVIEIAAIFLPLLFHMIYGIYIANAGVKFNTTKYNYGGNVRYFLQRVTAYLLLAFLIYHVGTLHKWGFSMLNVFASEPPAAVEMQKELNKMKDDYEVASDPANTPTKSDLAVIEKYKGLQQKISAARDGARLAPPPAFNPQNLAYQSTAGAIKKPYGDREGLNVCVIILYLLGIWAAVFHWANGLWTSAIAWGLTVTAGAQKRWGHVCCGFGIFMLIVGTGAWTAFAIVGNPKLPETETWTMPAEESANVHGQATGGNQSGGVVKPAGDSASPKGEK
jgi:succinate dehydrogenase/fumarate reductase cytochrome b subunit